VAVEQEDQTMGRFLSVAIRQAHPADAAHIAAVHVETWRTAYPRFLPESVLAGLSVVAERAEWERLLSDGRTETWVGLIEGVIVGWAILGPPRDDDVDPARAQELYGLYLLPRFWGRGVGQTLCQTAENRMRERGAQSAVLWVHEQNQRARRFYERRAYLLETGRPKVLAYNGVQAPAVRYRKALPGLYTHFQDG
jgi:ribosomal protein S18 acetylase RimI-like enzyme